MRRRALGAGLFVTGSLFAAGFGTALAVPARAAIVPAPATPAAVTTPAGPGPVPTVFAGDVQAVAVRIEADEPLPAGPGDIPSMTGQINAQENFATATAAVDLMGSVVGPKVADPTGDGHQYVQLPQATCVYPSQPNTDAQSYPTDGTDQQTAQSETTCADGPAATGQAYAAQIGGNAGVTNPNELQTLGLSALPLGISGAVSGHETLGPDASAGAVRVAADAEAHDFSIPGLLHVAGIEATGWSQASGRPGGAATSAQVTVSGLTIAGTSVSLTPAGVALGSAPAVPLSADGPVVGQFNSVAASVGCNLTVLSSPPTYPQGPLFSRPPLPDRVAAAGTDAGSTAAGMLVRCVVPDNLNPTNFKPLILQVLLGFVGTEAAAGASSPPSSGGGLAPTGGGGTGGVATSAPSGFAASSAPVGVAGGPSLPGSAGGGLVGPGAVASGPSAAPPRTAGAPDAASPPGEPPPRLGRLVPVRSALETAGMVLAVLIALAGVALFAPWRVTLAPVGHPEV